MKKELHIVDTTWSQGFGLGLPLLEPYKLEGLIRESARAGIRYFEVNFNFPDGTRSDPGIILRGISSLRQDFEDIYFQLHIDPKNCARENLDEILPHIDAGRIYLDPLHLEAAQPIYEVLQIYQKKIIIALKYIHKISPEYLVEISRKLQDQGIETLYLIDSLGNLTNAAIQQYFSTLRSNSKLSLGFQCRNTLGLAIENSLNAIENGATYIDASLVGIGRGAGIASLQILIYWLKQRGSDLSISQALLNSAAENFAFPLFSKIPYSREIDLLLSQYGLDFSPEEILLGIADILEMDIESLLIEIRKQDPQIVEIEKNNLQNILTEHRLNYEVVEHYLKTGQTP